MLAFIPSPSSGALHLGPLQLRAYGLTIALGVWAAVVVTARRFRARGGDGAAHHGHRHLGRARRHHRRPDLPRHHRLRALLLPRPEPVERAKIWDGGLGIWGGILLGVVVGAYVGHRHGADIRLLFDSTAPALPLAQAIGRWGNWWNQELYGKPTRLPWALEINPAHRVAAYAQYKTFQPTFLYESIWDLCVVGIVLLVERRFHLRKGSLLGVYVAAYTFGRFFTEYERIDFAHKIGPLRLNDWTSVRVRRRGRRSSCTTVPAPRPIRQAGPAAPGRSPPTPASTRPMQAPPMPRTRRTKAGWTPRRDAVGDAVPCGARRPVTVDHGPGAGLLLIGHGSRSAAGRDELLALGELVARSTGSPVETGFLEFSDPPAGAALDRLVERGAQRIAVLPLMLNAVATPRATCPAVVLEGRARHPDVCLVYGRALGIEHRTVSVALERIARVGGTGVPLLVVARGTSEPEANADAARAARLLARVIPVPVRRDRLQRADLAAGARGPRPLPAPRCRPAGPVRLVPLHRGAGPADEGAGRRLVEPRRASPSSTPATSARTRGWPRSSTPGPPRRWRGT